jgi:hypothetical protein
LHAAAARATSRPRSARRCGSATLCCAAAQTLMRLLAVVLPVRRQMQTDAARVMSDPAVGAGGKPATAQRDD